MPRFRCAAFVCLALLAFPATAEEVTWPRMLSSRLELQTDHEILAESEDFLSPLTMHGQLRLNGFLSAQIDGALLFSRSPPVFGFEKETWGVGNISAGLTWLKMVAPTVALSIGLSVAVGARSQQASAFDMERMDAAARRGGLDIALFLPNNRFMQLPVEVELLLGPIGMFRSRITPVVWMPTSSVPTATTALSIEHWDELTTVIAGGLRGGGRLQAVLFLGDDITHNQSFLLRTSVIPFLEFEPGARGAFYRLAVLLPLTGDPVITKTGARYMLQLQTGVVF